MTTTAIAPEKAPKTEEARRAAGLNRWDFHFRAFNRNTARMMSDEGLRYCTLIFPAGTELADALAQALELRAIPRGKVITCHEIQTDDGIWRRADGRPFAFQPEKARFTTWAELDAEADAEIEAEEIEEAWAQHRAEKMAA